MKQHRGRRVLAVILDGIGVREESLGNAVVQATTPALEYLKHHGLYTTLRASGPAVGLPTPKDVGNSEVGHNALGAGQVYTQGAGLVNRAITSKALWQGSVWRQAIKNVIANGSTLHFIGLLSDANVHSHSSHLEALLQQAANDGITRIRVHTLLDGRDVSPRSAEKYLKPLEDQLNELWQRGCDARIASGGGRMLVTMDRYEADWRVVERGWRAHVLGIGEHEFSSTSEALRFFRKDPDLGDQFIPSFVICDDLGPVGPIDDGDSVILFNFRGDRALELSQAFEDPDFSHFSRERHPDVFFAGMLQYDGDTRRPKNFLVSPPAIKDTLGEYLAHQGLRQFACSETQKFGHVTYFWNGNRSGYFDPKLEKYVCIPSDRIAFELKPWMKAHEITSATVAAMAEDSFDFGRINYPNGDMVGHTGDLEAAIIAVATVDAMLKRLIVCAQATNVILLVTADHGNCEEMFEAGSGYAGKPSLFSRPSPKTSHTLAEVPCYIYDPAGPRRESVAMPAAGSLANVANTVLELLGLAPRPNYATSLFKEGL